MNRPNIHELNAKSAANRAAWKKPEGLAGQGSDPASATVASQPGRSVERQESEIEAMFAQYLRTTDIPTPMRNFVFLPNRKLELDFAWPDKKVGVEIEGAVHRIRERFHGDIEKHALAILNGWVVMRVDGRSIRSGKAIEWFDQLFRSVASRAPARHNSADGMEGTPMK